jgi:diadenosine tetraphosphate (Ap4A) HIT family hydrolase
MTASLTFVPPANACPGCELCETAGGVLVATSERYRVIRVEDAAFPAFYRVVWNAHAAEFTDLGLADRTECIEAVVAVERVLREQLHPTKINLASLGNMTPHVHWHVIARFDWDSHFPNPVWGTAQRSVQPEALSRLPVTLQQLDAAVAAAFDGK